MTARERTFRILAGVIAALYVVARIIRPPAMKLADLQMELGMAAVIAVFVMYAAFGARLAGPAQDDPPGDESDPPPSP